MTPSDDSDQHNLASALLRPHVTAGRAESTALRHRGRDVTYAEVADRVARAASVLRSVGTRPEERVVLLLPDGPDFVSAFLGAIWMGAVPVPVNPDAAPGDLALPIVDSRATTVVCAGSALPRVEAVLREHRTRVRAVVTVGGEVQPAGTQVAGDLSELLAGAVPADVEATSADDVAFWLYSSGTTGRPKAVAHTHGAPVHSFQGFAQGVLGLTSGDRIFSVARMFSASGLGNSIFFPFFAGGSAVVVSDPPTGASLVADVTAERPTVLFARPASYRAIVDSAPPGAIPSVRLAVSSGDRLPGDLRREFLDRYGVEVLEGVGATETLHIYLCNRPDRIRPGSSGQLVPGYDARIVGEDGIEVADGEIGDLHVRGGSTLLCYWRNRAKSRETLLGDWVVTGDKYTRDADGFYWYAGRSDDMWLDQGTWMSPVPVEEALTAHPDVVEAGVTRVLGSGPPSVLACVTLRDPGRQTAGLTDQLAAWVEERLGPARRPDRIVVVGSLPQTPSGKVQRHRLPELPSAGREAETGGVHEQ